MKLRYSAELYSHTGLLRLGKEWQGEVLKARREEMQVGKSWVHHDPLQKIEILSRSRMRELVRVLSEV